MVKSIVARHKEAAAKAKLTDLLRDAVNPDTGEEREPWPS